MTEERGIPRRSRRRFLHEMAVGGIAGLVSILVAGPLIGFFFGVLAKNPSLQWVRVCSLDQINSITPQQFMVAFRGENASVPFQVVQGVFVIRRDTDILAFGNVCTHMGCPVRWLDWRQQILCPCHGGIYDRWGQLMGGPPSESLPLFLSRIEGNDLYVANQIIPRGNLLRA